MFQIGKKKDFSIWNSLEISFMAAWACYGENSNLILLNKNHQWIAMLNARNTNISQVGTQYEKAKTQIILYSQNRYLLSTYYAQ